MTDKKGKLFGIGVGPGDYELLTIKAKKILEKVPIICSPRSVPGKESIALSIIDPIIKKIKKENEEENKSHALKLLEPVFPMTEDKKILETHWDDASNLIAEHLDKGENVAFITLGDPSIYSTFSYVQKRLEKNYKIDMVPGINSFTACASSIGKPLVEKDEILMIIPKIDKRIETLLKDGNNFVLMKTSRNTEELENIIHEQEGKKDITSVQNCTMENEKIFNGFPKNKPYLTTTILKLKK
ncbi:S-adenosyl-L-methionine-dependent uroporphyrinogen III methyltransferase [Candidatus Methanobinarius endosymbioticus]|uniref:S-adenosyl-L-methionine-dependent uroporphyrinogen III methyltransferase n=1 Tax=Candidatus Methanobinarius endosymbioticus TaxID=2006182 RepID=A0A366M908_9EURY|nr:S-adenosyl-L-methionine-dependent uroporphyrinogen III methyltransferase [Candidatus Methanobinarius endosymbioticus]